MADQLVRSGRKPRADAQRNRERLLEAATQVFNQGGAEASLEAVARQAEVGIGTLYRHFPTREALFEAIYRREVQQLAALAEQLEGEASPPVEAVRRWVHALIGFVAVKKGMSAALAIVAQSSSNLAACMLDQMVAALDRLLRRAVAAREMRGDIGAEEVLRALVGMCYMQDTPDWRRNVLRTADIFIDGLRYAAPGPQPAER
ncbi:TetR/AcrR family transcriptional regulator [Pseudoroseomonas ludipueritiae]|uniref:TetR/AcrR family transcriptional regulator n=1 Tax=Pseudoroseomonas ludipueritiae TaxID=198093 RepID=A0ABR7R1G6_9PROT|nr:TetR/AcrR family transcriptional regulator [Pseudoroseomonas ludipueritiae]MBC9175564.1 TetR/AcrR family transcriptional regulator [Pseudoroseomonas ludipueritiae]